METNERRPDADQGARGTEQVDLSPAEVVRLRRAGLLDDPPPSPIQQALDRMNSR